MNIDIVINTYMSLATRLIAEHAIPHRPNTHGRPLHDHYNVTFLNGDPITTTPEGPMNLLTGRLIDKGIAKQLPNGHEIVSCVADSRRNEIWLGSAAYTDAILYYRSDEDSASEGTIIHDLRTHRYMVNDGRVMSTGAAYMPIAISSAKGDYRIMGYRHDHREYDGQEISTSCGYMTALTQKLTELSKVETQRIGVISSAYDEKHDMLAVSMARDLYLIYQGVSITPPINMNDLRSSVAALCYTRHSTLLVGLKKSPERDIHIAAYSRNGTISHFQVQGNHLDPTHMWCDTDNHLHFAVRTHSTMDIYKTTKPLPI